MRKAEIEKELAEIGRSIHDNVGRISTLIEDDRLNAYRRGFDDGKAAGRQGAPPPTELPEDFETTAFDDEMQGLREAADALKSVGQQQAQTGESGGPSAGGTGASGTAQGGSQGEGQTPSQGGVTFGDAGTGGGASGTASGPSGEGAGGTDKGIIVSGEVGPGEGGSAAQDATISDEGQGEAAAEDGD